MLDDHTVAYLDVVGSGAETIAHIRENGRVVVMLCAFQGPPRILRLHGTGEIVPATDGRFGGLFEQAGFEPFEVPESHRSIVVVHVNRVADSCGYGVPLMDYVGERPHQAASSAKRVRRARGLGAYVELPSASTTPRASTACVGRRGLGAGALDLERVRDARAAVDLPGDVDLVVLAVGADPQGAPEPLPEAELALLDQLARRRSARRRGPGSRARAPGGRR